MSNLLYLSKAAEDLEFSKLEIKASLHPIPRPKDCDTILTLRVPYVHIEMPTVTTCVHNRNYTESVIFQYFIEAKRQPGLFIDKHLTYVEYTEKNMELLISVWLTLNNWRHRHMFPPGVPFFTKANKNHDLVVHVPITSAKQRVMVIESSFEQGTDKKNHQQRGNYLKQLEICLKNNFRTTDHNKDYTVFFVEWQKDYCQFQQLKKVLFQAMMEQLFFYTYHERYESLFTLYG